MWMHLFFYLSEMGLVMYSRKYANPRPIDGSCGGKAHIMGWVVIGACFGNVTMPMFFELVGVLGSDIMLGHRLMSILGTITDHGSRAISARHVKLSYNTLIDGTHGGEGHPQLTVGHSEDGIATESEPTIRLCRFHESWDEAFHAPQEFSPNLEHFTQPVAGIFHTRHYAMSAHGALEL